MLNFNSFFKGRGKFISLLLVALLLAAAFAGTARALLPENTYSDLEKIGFAFYKLGGGTPDLEAWVKDSELYRKAKPADKIDIMQYEVNRLSEGLREFDLKDDLIHVVADITLLPQKNKRGEAPKTDGNLNVIDTRAIVIKVASTKDPFFFYKVSPYWVALIPHHMEEGMGLEMTGQEYSAFLKKLGYKGNYKRDVVGIIDMYLRPLSLETHEPITKGRLIAWPMIVEVGSMVIWDSARSQVAWSYNSAWYVPEERRELLNLYKD